MSRAAGTKQSVVQATVPSTVGPVSAAALLPRLVPQLTGDSGIMKRFSIASWGSTSSPTSSPDRTSIDLSHRRRDSAGSTKSQIDGAAGSTLQPQSTGGLWSSWWTSSGGEKGAVAGAKETEKTPKWYVDGLRSGQATDMKLVKHLISLRVHLSTASLVWIEEFVGEERGMEAIGKLLSGLVSKGGKRKKLADIEETVLLEIIKCLRVLLNTEVGTFDLYDSAISLRCLAAWFQRSIEDTNSYYSYRLLTPWLFCPPSNTHIRGLGSNMCFVADGRPQGSSRRYVRLSRRV